MVIAITRIIAAYNSLLNTAELKPTPANIRPTSPLGTIETPMASLVKTVSLVIKKPAANFVMMAISIRELVIIQIKGESHAIALKLSVRPIVTKKIGVNK